MYTTLVYDNNADFRKKCILNIITVLSNFDYWQPIGCVIYGMFQM